MNTAQCAKFIAPFYAGWSDDVTVPGASGAGEQNHPTITLDREGNLHLAWIERTTIDGPTRVRYLFGNLSD